MSDDETRKDESVNEAEQGAGAEEAEPATGAGEDAASAGSGDGEVAQLREQLEEQKEEVLRAKAEMQNIRRRAEIDVEKAHKFGTEKFVKELLPVVDSLEKAVESAQNQEVQNEEVVSRIKEGVDMTLDMFIGALSKFNVEQINPVGEPFDPQRHEAMSMVPSNEAEPNTVIAVMQKGYLLHERVVRPAMVMVAKADDSGGGNVDEQA
ncbi:MULTISPECIES: nucleotide exchange factor GrpE [Halomonadaceae]|uniref:Protein GrpE n=1 Tax=Vreelandella halophila TaxID=86177 RepID=A0A9X4YCH8_9GAMM|nr:MULTISPECIES: nucleotide exchange factor GrpE [Halomonas]MYL27337.1 nucleotide exchange factor GrpE [Halomonas utahensis]MYL76104.1 nucleotide exchange factor GrpE [Halomonas sp. 22501_18_FS]